MPHSMPFAEQKNKWFAVILLAGLPFFVIYRWMKGNLPYIENPNKKISKKTLTSGSSEE